MSSTLISKMTLALQAMLKIHIIIIKTLILIKLNKDKPIFLFKPLNSTNIVRSIIPVVLKYVPKIIMSS